MDNRTIKYEEEIPKQSELTDDEFLAKVGGWLERSEAHYQKTGNSLVFVGKQGIARLHKLATTNK